MKKPISILMSLIFMCVAFVPDALAGTFRKNTVVMGTALEMTIDTAGEEAAETVFSSVEREMKRIEGQMSEWIEGSPLTEVNRAAGVRPVKVPGELFNVISAAMKVSELSGGAFDITWASMRGLWDFRAGHERLPSPEEVKKRLALVDYRDVVMDASSSTVFLKRKGMAIGLGAIAKGYAVDKAMEAVIASGVTNAIIKAGGDIRVQGVGRAGEAGWDVGIQDPRDRGRLMARLTLSNASISTSGDYERFFMKDGRLYHHIMDPKTGYPATGTRSVTVIGPDTMTTDALSTAIFVLGPQKGMELAKKLPGIELMIIDNMGVVTASGGMELRR
ncbi:FAD:protein FMN transferase [uncultured bacterium]|nr:FAD:protein FMN transferase [uncultured bacterium]